MAITVPEDRIFSSGSIAAREEIEWRDGQLADIYTFRNGKAIQVRVFADRQEALEWAGVEALDAN